MEETPGVFLMADEKEGRGRGAGELRGMGSPSASKSAHGGVMVMPAVPPFTGNTKHFLGPWFVSGTGTQQGTGQSRPCHGGR